MSGTVVVVGVTVVVVCSAVGMTAVVVVARAVVVGTTVVADWTAVVVISVDCVYHSYMSMYHPFKKLILCKLKCTINLQIQLIIVVILVFSIASRADIVSPSQGSCMGHSQVMLMAHVGHRSVTTLTSD